MEGEQKVKTVQHVSQLEVFFTSYTDGNGAKEDRIVCRPKGTKKFFFMFPNGVEASMKPASTWLQNELEGVIDSSKSNGNATIKIDKVKIKAGDPAER